MVKNINVKPKNKLERQMALVSAILTGAIVLTMAAFVIFFLNDISLTVIDQTKGVNRAVATSMFQILGQDVDKKNYEKISGTVGNAINSNLIAYFIVQDKATNRIEYSSIKKLKDKPFSLSLLNSITAKDTNNYVLEPKVGTYYISGAKKSNVMYVGFFSKAILSQSIEKFIDSLNYVVIIAIILGLFLSHLFIKIISKPLLNLSEAAKHFADGDFDYKIPYFNYEEIDRLVDSYNVMASTLSDLYISLENKVQERTQQLDEAYKELQNTQAMMVHSEKMKSLGELVAGITHEINNPVNFIYGNLIHLTNYTNDLLMLIDKYGDYESDLIEEHKKEIEQIKSDIDFAFLKEDLGALIQSCREGTERTKNIIMDLKNFSRMEERVLSSINISKEIDTTLNILHSKYKNRVEIHKEYDENLPLVESFGGQLNQVFMNILDNAFYAIEGKGDVYISTKQSENNVIIEIRDNGKGMEKETAEKIFDPFFTTKPVGQGTGLGMSISYRVIQEHKGKISVQSEKGVGTIFTIVLPVSFRKEESDKNEQ